MWAPLMAIREYIAYVDEAGDEGLGKLRDKSSGQSKWLAIGCTIVSAENDRNLVKWRDEIMAQFPKKKTRDLHFRYLNHAQSVAACQYLSDKPLGICVVASNKITLLDSPKLEVFKQPGHLYNYLVRYLLERITTACLKHADREKVEARLRVVFSRRPNTDYQSMHNYLCLMRDGREKIPPVRSILWKVFSPDDIDVINHSKSAGLQISDVVTSATVSALEPNMYGNCEPRYSLSLKERYISHNGSRLNCGLTLIPPPNKSPLTDDHRKYIAALEEKAADPRPPDAHR